MARQAVAPLTSTRLRWNWRWLPLLAAGLIFLGILLFATLRPIKVLPRMRLSPSFALIDQAGRKLTSEDLRGQVVLYGFGYSRCGASCSEIEHAMRGVQRQLLRGAAAGVPVRMVLISVDPEVDDATALSAYADRLGADPERWRFATGAPASLKQTVGGGFEVFYGTGADGQLRLDPALVLVDGAGIIRREYRAHDVGGLPDADRLMSHIALLQEEARGSEGLGRLAYEAAHLFVCYAP